MKRLNDSELAMVNGGSGNNDESKYQWEMYLETDDPTFEAYKKECENASAGTFVLFD